MHIISSKITYKCSNWLESLGMGKENSKKKLIENQKHLIWKRLDFNCFALNEETLYKIEMNTLFD